LTAAAYKERSSTPVGRASQPIAPFKLVAGPRGIGKTCVCAAARRPSAVLTHVLHYARTSGWVTLVMPSARRLMRDGLVLTPSRSRPGFLDQHDFALEMIGTLLKLHGEQLAGIPQRGSYSADKYLPAEEDARAQAERERQREDDRRERARRKAEARARGEAVEEVAKVAAASVSREGSGFTLRDMAQWAQAHPTFATDALLDLKRELCLQTEFPVLIAVDELNWLYEQSFYPHKGEVVPTERLSLPMGFRMLSASGFDATQAPARGMVLAATSFRSAQEQPFYAAVRVSKSQQLVVPPLSRAEVHSQLLHYSHTGKFFEIRFREDVDPHAVEYFRTMSGGNPWELQRAAMLVF
jgi:hypothetical protein